VAGRHGPELYKVAGWNSLAGLGVRRVGQLKVWGEVVASNLPTGRAFDAPGVIKGVAHMAVGLGSAARWTGVGRLHQKPVP
jgi:hypothetical protein